MKKISILASFITVFILVALILPGCVSHQQPELKAPTIITRQNSISLFGIDPLTLDPATSAELTSLKYVTQIFSGLVKLEDTDEPEPDIAESWDVSDGGRVYTFHLRKGVRFQDGKEVKAQDFKYSWERACRPDTSSTTAATYLGDIVGAGDMLAGKADEIKGIKVINDYTLQVTIDAPKSYFLYKLLYPTAFVVDKANVESGKDWWHTPNGTGPYKLNQWDEKNLLVLEKNRLYYGEQAKTDIVVFRLWSGRPMNMYETGDIDVTDVSLSYIDKVTDKNGSFYQDLVQFPELNVQYIGFNCAKPPFGDVNIRRAFSYAIDKDTIISLMLRDTARGADGILPPGIPGYNSNLVGLKYDVNKAKELIRASKYGDVSHLPPITVTTGGWGGGISPELEAVIYQWRQNLGVDVTVKQIEPQRYFYHMKEDIDQLFDAGWVADYPHPQDFLDILFHTGADINYGAYSNSAVDQLLDQAGVEQDRQVSLGLYQQAEQLIVDDAACLPLWFGENYVLIKPFVKGYSINALGLPVLRNVHLDFQN
jgi:oligopeptide transport system substrate-binding protein